MRELTNDEVETVAGGWGSMLPGEEDLLYSALAAHGWTPPSSDPYEQLEAEMGAQDFINALPPGQQFAATLSWLATGSPIDTRFADPNSVQNGLIRVTVPGAPDDPNTPEIEVNVRTIWIEVPQVADANEFTTDGGFIVIADDLSGSFSRNPVFNITPVDGATYWAPSHIDAQYIEDAIAYLQELPMHARIAAFWDMYTDINHPHFMDIKDFRNGGQITYFSQSLDRNVTSSAYEPFGNFLYGYVGVRGGVPVDVLMFAAAVTQHGRVFSDDPADRPFVEHGIQAAEQVMNGIPALPDPRPPAVLNEPINPRETGVPTDISHTPLDRTDGGD